MLTFTISLKFHELQSASCRILATTMIVPGLVYHNDPKYLDRQIWAHSVDADQNEGAV